MANQLLDDFFAEIIVELEEKEYTEHPSNRTLQDYLRQRLRDQQEVPGENWNLSAVSLHIATCAECSKRIAKLRAEELKTFWKRLSERSLERIVAFDLNRRSTIYLPLAGAAASLILLIVSLLPGPALAAAHGGGSATPKLMM